MSAPQSRTHFDSDQSKRSWRTIKPANGDTMRDVSQVQSEPLSRDNCGWQLNHRRKNTGKECVQCAAAVHFTIAVMVNCVDIVIVQVSVMIVDAQSSRLGERFGAGKRRRYNPRELGDYEERDQYTNEALYCAEPGHQRPPGCACSLWVSGSSVNLVDLSPTLNVHLGCGKTEPFGVDVLVFQKSSPERSFNVSVEENTMQKRIPIWFSALTLTIALNGMALGQTPPAPNASDQDHSTHHPPTVSDAPMAAPGSGTSSGTAQSSQGDMIQDGMMGQRGMTSGGMMGRGMMAPRMMGSGMMAGRYGENGSDQLRMGRGAMGPMMMRIIFSLMDADGDGKLSLQEFQAAHERIFKAMDANKDGFVTLEEMQNFMRGISKPASQQ